MFAPFVISLMAANTAAASTAILAAWNISIFGGTPLSQQVPDAIPTKNVLKEADLDLGADELPKAA